jgi:hypothetical protein
MMNVRVTVIGIVIFLEPHGDQYRNCTNLNLSKFPHLCGTKCPCRTRTKYLLIFYQTPAEIHPSAVKSYLSLIAPGSLKIHPNLTAPVAFLDFYPLKRYNLPTTHP